jgi:hypothetical protein
MSYRQGEKKMKLNELIKESEMTDQEKELADKYHKVVLSLWKNPDITWDGTRKEGSRYLEVTVDDFNKCFCYTTARKISNMRGSSNDKYKGNNPTAGELLGVLGEIVICKALGTEFDTSIGCRRGGEDTTYEGITIDIKTCMLHNNDSDKVVIDKDKRLEDAQCYWFSKFIVGPDKKRYIELYSHCRNVDIINEESIKLGQSIGKSGYWKRKTELKTFNRILQDNNIDW